MKEKKLSNFEDLKKIKFENLSPDPDPEIIQVNKTSLNKQYLEAHFSSKGRAGKIVTVIKGFEGSINEVKTIEKKIKKTIGVGGSLKNNEIIIQGNYREKIISILRKMGHEVKKVGG